MGRFRNAKSAFARFAAAVIAASLVVLAAPAMANAYRVVNLPASGNSLLPRLAMNDAGDYVITWRQQILRGGNERAYVQTGNVHRPFRSRPVNVGKTVDLWGPIETVDNTNSKGLAWMQGSGDNVRAAFAGPGPVSGKTVAWVGANNVKVATLGADGTTHSIQNAGPAPYIPHTYGARASHDGAGVPTVYWSRGGSNCPLPVPLSASSADDCEEVHTAVFVASGDAETGSFGPVQFAGIDCQEGTMVQDRSGAAGIFLPCGPPRNRYAYRQPGQPFARPQSLPLKGAKIGGIGSIALLPGGRVLVVYEALTQLDRVSFEVKVLAATGPIGGRLGPPRQILRKIRFGWKFGQQPTPRLAVGNGGRAYLTWYSRTRTRIAMVKPSLRLGQAMTVPGFDRRQIGRTMLAEVAVSNSGRALAMWSFVSKKMSALRATTFDVPRR